MIPQLNKVYSARDIARLYAKIPGIWLLLEVVEEAKDGGAKKFKLLKYAKDKQALHEFIMDEDENWNWNKKYLLVFADPDKECPLI